MTERRKPLNSLQKEDFVELIRRGVLKYDAATRLGVSVPQIEYAVRNDPDFRADLEDAQREATEPVENALYEAAKAGEPWANKFWLAHADPVKWGDKPKQITITHELDGTALLQSVAGIREELETRRMHARAIETGGQMIEIEPVRRYEHPAVYDLGKAPVMPNEILRKMKDTYGLPRHAHSVPVENVDSPLLNELPRRPGT